MEKTDNKLEVEKINSTPPETPQEPSPDKVAYFFAENPLSTEVYETSDGFLFGSKQDALTHANTLEMKDLKTHLK